MSHIRVNIDRLVINGLEPGNAKALADELQAQLSRVLSDRTERAAWARSHRTPLLKLPQMSLKPGLGGGRKLGKQIAQAVGRGLKP